MHLKTISASQEAYNPHVHKFLAKRVNAYYQNRVEKTWHGGHIMKGKIPTESSLLLQSNDYLSLSNHPWIIQKQIEALKAKGNGILMSAVFQQGETPQSQLENNLAHFLKAETAVVCQSGWCANIGLVQAIADEKTPVYIDMFAHMSLWEGIRSAGAIARPFRHNSPKHLEMQIRSFGPGIVLVDSVYSVTGSLCPLENFSAICKKFGCIFVVDESHSLGTHGEKGEGLVVSERITQGVHFRTASLAKAFCGLGGIVAGSERNIEYLRYEARPLIFSSALPPVEIQSLLAGLEIIRKENWRREKLHWNARYLRKKLDELGYNVSEGNSQIISLVSGSEEQTIILRDALEKRDVFGSVFCFPATPAKRATIRFSINCSLSREQLDYIATVCKDIKEDVDMKNWPSTRKKVNQLQKTKDI